jgi:hypothetical protein
MTGDLLLEMQAIKEPFQPEDVFPLVRRLCCDDARTIADQNRLTDGGWIAP